MRALRDRPLNTNQLAEALALDYTTVQHHLKVLEENGMVFGKGPKYGRTFFLTPKMEADLPAFDSIWEKLDGKKSESESEHE
ncbi:MAG: winged helix-turn-helix domain-containing protein [Thermoplasmatota archaeon]